jgi:hypothetical protein
LSDEKKVLFLDLIEKDDMPGTDVILKLAPEASKDLQRLILEFRDREKEIESWFREDPERLALSKKDPKRVMKGLLEMLMLEESPEVRRPELDGWDVSLTPTPIHPDLTLLKEVGKHVTSNPEKAEDFTSDPAKTIRWVAANTNAGEEETNAVIKVFETTLGISSLEISPIDRFKRIVENKSRSEHGGRSFN